MTATTAGNGLAGDDGDSLSFEEAAKRIGTELKSDIKQWLRTEFGHVAQSTVENVQLKRKAHEQQYKFNGLILKSLQKIHSVVDEHLPLSVSEEISDEFATTIDRIEQRQKDIRIADSSVAGWDTVAELHLAKGIEDDSTKAQEIRDAEAKALRKRRLAGGGSHASRTGGYPDRSVYQPYPSQHRVGSHSQYSGNNGGPRARPDDRCYNCGRKGHYAEQCRSRPQRERFEQRARNISDDGRSFRGD